MRIFSNTAISLDGKTTLIHEKHEFLGSAEDRKNMSRLRAEADAILVGGNSFRNWPYPLLPNSDDLEKCAPQKKWLQVVVSRRMDFNKILSNFVGAERLQLLFFTRKDVKPPHFPHEVLFYPNDPTISQIVEELNQRGIKNLLVEGGGNLIYQFLKYNLLHEMYITICPKIIGNYKSPSLADGPGLDRLLVPQMILKECRTFKNEIFLHYVLEKNRS